MRICQRCKGSFPDDFYYKNTKRKDGLSVWCKDCCRKYRKSEKYKEYAKEYRKRPDVIERNREYQSHPSRVEQRRIYAKSDRAKELKKEYLKRDYVIKKVNECNRSLSHMYSSIRCCAKKRGYSFTMSRDFFYNLFNGNKTCFYCGMSSREWFHLKNYLLSYSGKNEIILEYVKKGLIGRNMSNDIMSVDRKCSYRGYDPDNVVVSCMICNWAKGWLLSCEDMQIIAPRIIKRLLDEVKKETEPEWFSSVFCDNMLQKEVVCDKS